MSRDIVLRNCRPGKQKLTELLSPIYFATYLVPELRQHLPLIEEAWSITRNQGLRVFPHEWLSFKLVVDSHETCGMMLPSHGLTCRASSLDHDGTDRSQTTRNLLVDDSRVVCS
jgi:hypothetical protein